MLPVFHGLYECVNACAYIISLCLCVFVWDNVMEVFVFELDISWWFSIDRREANKQLMMPTNPSGTFLIRNSTGWLSTWIYICYVAENLYGRFHEDDTFFGLALGQ